MIYNLYELHPIITENGVYKNHKKKPCIVATVDTHNQGFFEYMEEHFYHGLCWDEEFMGNMKLDDYYYVVPDSGYECYVFSPHLGFSFWDIAEHEDRVMIAVELEIDSDKMCI